MRRQAAALLFGLLAAAIGAGSLFADETTLVVPATVNGIRRGEFVIAIAGDDVRVRIVDLENAGASGPAWQKLIGQAALTPLQGSNAVSLKSLQPVVSYTFDEAELSLAIVLDPQLLATTELTANSLRPAGMIYATDTSTFLNYALTSTAFHKIGLFSEIGRSVHGNLLYSSFSRSADGEFRRGVTNYTIDQRYGLRRWTIGDTAVSVSDPLGGGAVLAGVTVSRNFGLDPYFIRQPAMTLRGTALAPSKVDVYVNGVLVAQRDVPPGEFELKGLPVTTGAGNVRLVVRDPFGGERSQTSGYYASSSVLARGLSEFTYSVGALRTNFGTSSSSYGDPALVAQHRRGITDALTAGGRVEATRDVWSLGPSMALRSRFGDVSLSLGASSQHGLSGSATSFSYRYLARTISFGASMESLSRQYANLSLDAAKDRALTNLTGYVAASIPHGSVTLQWNSAKMRDSEDSRGAALITSLAIGSRVSVFASGGVVEQGGSRHREASLGISIYAGRNVTANSTFTSRGLAKETVTDVQRPLPVGSGIGYRLHNVTTGSVSSSTGVLQYQNGVGRYEASLDPNHPRSPELSAAGGVILESGHLALTRPVQDSFALVRVPGVPNVRVYSANQLIGRTDRNGDLFLPSLLAYYGNQIRIEDQDIPLDYSVRSVDKTIAPPYRGGALIEFPVARVQTISGKVMVGSAPPSFGQITIVRGEEKLVSPLGRDGEFYFENAGAGKYQGMVEWSEGRCAFTFEVPQKDDSILDLGTLTCAMEQKR